MDGWLPIGALLTLIVLVGVLLYFLNRSLQKAHEERSRHFHNDHASIMILFQTMRDLLNQQKELVHQFNINIDRKLKMITKVVVDAEKRNEDLAREHQEMMLELDEAKEELKSLQRQMTYLDPEKSTAARPSGAPPEKTVRAPRAETQKRYFDARFSDSTDFSENPREALPEQGGFRSFSQREEGNRDSETSHPGRVDYGAHSVQARRSARKLPVKPKAQGNPTLNVIAGIDSPSTKVDSIEDSQNDWVGFDFAGDEPAPSVIEVPEEPEDAEAAREAFRALLNMDSGRASQGGVKDRYADLGDFATGRSSANEKVRGNGGAKRITPLQARVYEYSDAGMSLQEISRELGVGKGELRLMLNLRKEKQRGRRT